MLRRQRDKRAGRLRRVQSGRPLLFALHRARSRFTSVDAKSMRTLGIPILPRLKEYSLSPEIHFAATMRRIAIVGRLVILETGVNRFLLRYCRLRP